jgi:hypothetical protein
MQKGRAALLLLMAGLVACAVLSPAPGRAQLPPSSPSLSDREAMWGVMEGFFHIPVSQVKRWEGNMAFPDLNLPVALFISQQAHVSVDLLLPWRKTGRSWLAIATQLKLSPTIFFLPLPEEKLAPPYGKSYGYYWKHQKDKKAPIPLSDKEIADLVHLRIASSYFGLPPGQIMALRAEGKSFSKIYGAEYRKQHPGKAKESHGGKGKGKSGDEPGGPGKDKGMGSGSKGEPH